MSAQRLKEKIVLVTGASRGGGKGIALALGEEKATVYVSGRSVRGRPGNGLIVNITWVLDRPHGHAFYEVVKNATNKLTEQMADDLRPHGIACVAVSPGFMRLERMDLSPEVAAKAESPEFPGRALAALAADRNVLAKSGHVFTTPELAREYGFTDVNGKQQSAFWDEHWSGTWGA
jgi:NAD(P)-dependent dehydrogenase (short-subunit alcohol dehydrogenase family)